MSDEPGLGPAFEGEKAKPSESPKNLAIASDICGTLTDIDKSDLPHVDKVYTSVLRALILLKRAGHDVHFVSSVPSEHKSGLLRQAAQDMGLSEGLLDDFFCVRSKLWWNRAPANEGTGLKFIDIIFDDDQAGVISDWIRDEQYGYLIQPHIGMGAQFVAAVIKDPEQNIEMLLQRQFPIQNNPEPGPANE